MIVAAIRAAPELGVDQAVVELLGLPLGARARRAGSAPGRCCASGGRLLLGVSRWFQIESLYRFNAKFRPVWEPRFICYPGAGDIPRIALAALEAEAFIVWPEAMARDPPSPAPATGPSTVRFAIAPPVDGKPRSRSRHPQSAQPDRPWQDDASSPCDGQRRPHGVEVERLVTARQSAWESARTQLAEAVKQLGLDDGMHQLLATPRREMTVEHSAAPRRRQHRGAARLPGAAQPLARPGQGRHPLPPVDRHRRGPRPRDVDDLEVRADRHSVRRREGRGRRSTPGSTARPSSSG